MIGQLALFLFPKIFLQKIIKMIDKCGRMWYIVCRYKERRRTKNGEKEYKQIRAKSDKGREGALHLPRLEEKDIFVGWQDWKGDNEGDGEQSLDVLDIYKVCDRVLFEGDREWRLGRVGGAIVGVRE